MKKIYGALIGLCLCFSSIFAGPPPGAGVEGIPVSQPTTKGLNWIGFEYGWYCPSLKDLNDRFDNIFGGKRIGTNDYFAIGIGMPQRGYNRVGMFFGYWNGSIRAGFNTLSLHIINISIPEYSFGLFRIQEKAIFSPGFIVRDIMAWYTSKIADIDTLEFSVLTDIGAKLTAEYYPIKNLGIKLDLGRFFLGIDWMHLLGEEK